MPAISSQTSLSIEDALSFQPEIEFFFYIKHFIFSRLENAPKILRFLAHNEALFCVMIILCIRIFLVKNIYVPMVPVSPKNV